MTSSGRPWSTSWMMWARYILFHYLPVYTFLRTSSILSLREAFAMPSAFTLHDWRCLSLLQPASPLVSEVQHLPDTPLLESCLLFPVGAEWQVRHFPDAQVPAAGECKSRQAGCLHEPVSAWHSCTCSALNSHSWSNSQHIWPLCCVSRQHSCGRTHHSCSNIRHYFRSPFLGESQARSEE